MHCTRASRPPRAVVVATCEILHNEKGVACVPLRGEAVGSGSGACGVVRGVTPFLRDDPVYQQARRHARRRHLRRPLLRRPLRHACADARADARADVRADARADIRAVALAAPCADTRAVALA